MIRKFTKADLDAVMEIWLSSNMDAHPFIPRSHWQGNFEMVKGILPEAEVYVYQGEREILGFIGLTDSFIAGLFVKNGARSSGIGKRLLDHAKAFKKELRLTVYRKNARAVSFYQRERFAIQSEGPDENTGETEFVMGWEG